MKNGPRRILEMDGEEVEELMRKMGSNVRAEIGMGA